MEKFEIENVGINGDTVHVVGDILSGSGDIYSSDDHVDPISFKYDVGTKNFTSIFADKIFTDKLDEIQDILRDNLETNFVPKFRRF
jgi:hypothetical protein